MSWSRLGGWFSRLLHSLYGFISGLLWFVDWKLSVFLYILFFAYEYVEEEKIHDEMYHELKEYTVGFTAGLIAYIVCTAVFHIHVPVP